MEENIELISKISPMKIVFEELTDMRYFNSMKIELLLVNQEIKLD